MSETVSSSRCFRTGTCMLIVAIGLGTPQPCARAQAPGESVTGIVRDEAGQPVPNVQVSAQNTTVRTGEDGSFSLPISPMALPGQGLAATNDAGDLQASRFFHWSLAEDQLRKPVELTLLPPRQVRVQIVDADGRPVAGVRGFAVADWPQSTSAESDASGQVVLRLPAQSRIRALFAKKSALGFDYVTLIPEQQFFGSPGLRVDPPAEPVQLVLGGARTISVTVIDPDGKPMSDVRVYPWLFSKTADRNDLFNTAYVVDEFVSTTSSQGVATFDWLPLWEKSEQFVFWPMINMPMNSQRRASINMASGADSLTIQIERGVQLSGRATSPGGAPVSGVTISARGIGPENQYFGSSAQTGADGRYQIEVTPDTVCMLIVDDPKWAAPIKAGIVARSGTDQTDLDFELRAATRVTGRVTLDRTGAPVAGQQVTLQQAGMDANSHPDLKSGDGKNRGYIPPLNYTRGAETDADGRFEFQVGPGRYLLTAGRNAAPQQFEVASESSLQFDFRVDRPDRGQIEVRVVSGNPPQAVPDASVEVRDQSRWYGANVQQSDSQGRVQTERDLVRSFVYARSSDGTQSAVAEIGPDDKTVTVTLQPSGTAKGRLIRDSGGSPMRQTEFLYGIRPDLGVTLYGDLSFCGGSARTDQDGRFTLPNLVVGREYSIVVPRDGQTGLESDHVFTLSSAEPVDLGDIRISSTVAQPQAVLAPVPAAPPTERGFSWQRLFVLMNLVGLPLLVIGFIVWRRVAR